MWSHRVSEGFVTLRIPPDVPGPLVSAVAGHFPDCDEDALDRCGDSWGATGDSFLLLAEIITAITLPAVGVAAVAAIERQRTLSAHLEQQGEFCHNMAATCHKGAADFRHTKYVIIATLVILTAQLVADGFLLIGGEIEAIASRKATQTAVERAISFLIRKLRADGANAAASRAILARHALTIGAVQGGGVELIAQLATNPHHLDLEQLLTSTVAGGLGGLVGAEAGRLAVNRLANAVGADALNGARRVAATSRATPSVASSAEARAGSPERLQPQALPHCSPDIWPSARKTSWPGLPRAR